MCANWKVYERSRGERRKNVFAAININRGGLFLNRMACELVGMTKPGDERYILFYYDEQNKNLFGFEVLLNNQQHMKDLYKVKYRDANKTAKINARQFIIQNNLLERTLKIKQTTFPLIKEKEDFYYFELK